MVCLTYVKRSMSRALCQLLNYQGLKYQGL